MLSARNRLHHMGLPLAAGLVALAGTAQAATVLTNNDGVVYNSLCVGFDCPTNPSFGSDTIRLQENNLRIHFDDTSTAGSFPNQDWRIEANSNLNGGGEYLRIVDATANRNIFTVEANAPNNALYVDDGGRIGVGTATPVVELHVTNGDTPTLRLEQNSSSGFAPQTWDVAGNETSFFIRDATSGSTLPFRIRPGAASNALVIDTDNDVGIGTLSPAADLEFSTTETFTFIRLTATGAVNDSADMTYTDGAGMNGEIRYNIVDGDNQEMSLDADGNLTIDGEITTSGSCSGGCDLVFAPDYDLMPLERHAALMWEKRHLPNVGPTAESGPMNLSVKMGGMLNELEHAHIYIEQLSKRIEALEAALAEKG